MDIEASFKLFDIRGEYPSQVDERLAFVVGKALGVMKKPRKVLVASDTRESSPSLKNFLIDGLSTAAREVNDLFEVPVPQFYYTMASDGYDLGVMVTASHIRDSENGFKIGGLTGLPFDQGEVLTLKKHVLEMQNDAIVVPRIEATRINTTDAYIAAVLEKIGPFRPTLKVILDVTKSSVVTPVLIIFSRLSANYRLVKSNHTGNPLLGENQRDIGRMVVETNADLGVMWDSDGDRVVFIDRRGKMIPMSFVLGILAAAAIKRGPGKKALADIRAGLVVRDLVVSAGGVLEILPAWSPFIKFAIKNDSEVVFGGETSGHFTFSDFYVVDDGILAGLRFLQIFEQGGVEDKLKELAKKYFELPERNFAVGTKEPAAVLQRITEHWRNTSCQVSVADGLTVFGDDFRFNLRQSLTEPLLRLNLEARSATRAESLLNQVEFLIEKFKS